MSDTATQSFLASVDASNIDSSLQSQRISIPESLKSFNWTLIVAGNAATWSASHHGVQFFWDSNTSEVVIAGADDQAITDAVSHLTPILADESNVKSLEEHANQLFSGEHSVKRGRDEGAEGGEAEEADRSAPPNPAATTSTLPTSLYDESTLTVTPKQFFNPKAATGAAAGGQSNDLRPSRVEEEHRIPNDRVGLVIGAKGATIKTIKEVSGAYIMVEKTSEEGSSTRLVRITGTPEQVQRAKMEIDRVIDPSSRSNTGELGAGVVVESYPIPSNSVGTIIGRSGDTIRLLQMLTHCNIVMEKDEQAQGADTRSVQLTGTPEQIAAAKQNIDKLIEAHNQATAERPFDANLVLTGRPSHRTLDVKVSGSIIGMVIGKGGENVRRINEQSGARITVDKDTQNATRVVTVSASNERSLRTAERLIRELVTDCMTKKSRENNQQQQMPGMYGHQMYMGQTPSAGLPAYQQMYSHNPSIYSQPYMLQQQLMAASAATPAAAMPMASPLPTATNTPAAMAIDPRVPPEHRETYIHYYNHYKQSYPHEEAVKYALHYCLNPPNN